MKIIVDADACPVKSIIEAVAKKNGINVLMFVDTSHQLYSDYSKVITVSKSSDAVDFALINQTSPGDIVITGDYGVATMALTKGAYALHHSGKQYTNANIDQMLFERHLSKKQRKSGHYHGHIKKRTTNDDLSFKNALIRLVEELHHK